MLYIKFEAGAASDNGSGPIKIMRLLHLPLTFLSAYIWKKLVTYCYLQNTFS
jgi:hypothetical protein